MKPLTPKQKTKLNEGNILIAEFDGYQKAHDCMRWWIIRPVFKDMTTDDMKYHESWDALMPIWFKLSKAFDKMSRLPSNYDNPYRMAFFTGISRGDISSSWQVVVDAIKLLNKEN